MKTHQIYRPPLICYEVTEENHSFGINVYYTNHKGSPNPELNCNIRNLTSSSEKAHSFAKLLSENCALPLHVPELAEEFLSVYLL